MAFFPSIRWKLTVTVTKKNIEAFSRTLTEAYTTVGVHPFLHEHTTPFLLAKKKQKRREAKRGGLSLLHCLHEHLDFFRKKA